MTPIFAAVRTRAYTYFLGHVAAKNAANQPVFHSDFSAEMLAVIHVMNRLTRSRWFNDVDDL